MIEVRRLTAAEGHEHLDALAAVLIDCVDGGASVSFMAPLSKAEAQAYFQKTLASVECGERILLAAFDESQLVGTVQIITAMPPNQPHRADVAKLLVLRSARRNGVGARLMECAEEISRQAGKTLLVLDTATGDNAERLYLRLGWTRAGIIPNYAMYPDGRYCATTFFWKQI